MPHLKKVVSKGVEYYYIAESVREKGNIKTNIIRKLGKLTPTEKQYWERLLSAPVPEYNQSSSNNPEEFVNIRSLRHGILALGHGLWIETGLEKIFKSALAKEPNKKLNLKLFETMILNRLEEPHSKLSLLEQWLPTTSIPFLLSLPIHQLYDNQFYRAMDVVWKHRDDIEKEIWTTIIKPNTKGKILQKDITSSFFEGRGPPFARFNPYSRDHRPDCKQVCWGLVETEEGFPITMEVYPGNTVDKTTVKGSCTRLKKLFGIEKGIFVGDRGLTTLDNIKTIRSFEYSYVLAETNCDVQDILDKAKENGLDIWEQITDDQQTLLEYSVDSEYILKGTEVIRDDDRYIVAWSNDNESDDLQYLEKQLAKGRKIIDEVNQYAVNHQKVHHHKLLARAIRKLEEKKLSTYFRVYCKSEQPIVLGFEYTGKVDEAKKFAGYWVLRTDIKDKSGMEIIDIYRGKWILEQTFREIKDVLKVRPIRHRKDNRVCIHIWICVLAYLLKRICESRARQKDIAITGDGLIEKFREIRVNEDGFKGLEKRWFTVTLLNSEQRKIVEALHLEDKAFQIPQKIL